MINAPPLLQLLSQWPDRESRHAADKAENTGTLYWGSINVVPKREWDERKKLCTTAQQKTHAY
jgi:hypothetical protein